MNHLIQFVSSVDPGMAVLFSGLIMVHAVAFYALINRPKTITTR